MERQILEAIRRLLAERAVEWREVRHRAVRTSEEAARARGCPLAMGAKAIVLKTDDIFRLFVLSAARGLWSRGIRRELGVRRTRFATPEELRRLTGLEPGGVPPFGPPILDLELSVDPSLLENESIAFTPGERDLSILIDTADYLRVARPRIFPFSKPVEAR